MFQDFTVTSRPEQGPPRLAALREKLVEAGLAGFIVPRADAHQGEYVSAHDDRLAWLTGFTGSAGFCIALSQTAGVFIDGRYTLQFRSQVDLDHFTPVSWPKTQAGDWLLETCAGGEIGFDPWLHTAEEISRIEAALEGSTVSLKPCANLVDQIWSDQPAPPQGPVLVQPLEMAGESHEDKRARLAEGLRKAGQQGAVLTLPDSISWLLNIRGSDIPRNPVVHAFAILHEDARLSLFIDPAKLDEATRAHLGDGVELHAPAAFVAALRNLAGPIRVDRATAPLAVSQLLEEADIAVAWGTDPCILPKARKNAAEIRGMEEAHLRDGAAMVEFLAWLDATAPGDLTETQVVRQLENCRRATNALREISFETICGSGPHGAIVHYRVTEETDRPLAAGELLLVDSGGQYVDGTTDITRTIAIGPAGAEECAAFTRVLQGMIAISRARWPK
ncbi:M24 family metallopeptidase, partial [Thioclava sp. BHET1]